MNATPTHRLTHLARLVALGFAGAVAVSAVLIVIPYGYLLPPTFGNHPVEWGALVALVAYGVLATRRGERARAIRLRLVAGSGRVLDAWASPALGLFCVALLAGWLPQYLTWPWSRDTDTFATLAQGWDAGIRPYRDVIAYNFPGHTYLHWLLGRGFGWGRTMPFALFDGACVVGLGVVVLGWSRRRLGGFLPGLAAYLAFLQEYLALLFDMAAQRDWHAGLGVVLALLAVQTRPDRLGRIVSALCAALALSIRPQAVLFLPAIALAIDEGSRSLEPGWRRRVLALVEWALAFAGFAALAFAPLIAQGIADDFLRGLRIAAYGGPYSQANPSRIVAALIAEFGEPRAMTALVATLLVAGLAPPDLRRLARPWCLAWLGVLFWAPISPVGHDYLRHPFHLVAAITTAMPVAWLLRLRSPARPVILLATALAIYEIIPVIPRFCLPRASLAALPIVLRGESVPATPAGAYQVFLQRGANPPTDWKRYLDVLDYLRARVAPTTFVANVLNRYPFEPVNGPSGRLSPFGCESGICWMHWVAIDLDPSFAASLEAARDAVVVWEPAQFNIDGRMALPRTLAVIRRLYQPEARFDAVEIWRRR